MDAHGFAPVQRRSLGTGGFGTRHAIVAAALARTFAVGAPAALAQGDEGGGGEDRVVGHVYTLTNESAGNRLAVFDRRADGTLELGELIDTGGLGLELDGGLGNAFAIAFARSKRFLYAVNPGDDTISVFSLIEGDRPVLKQVVDSGGQRPISLCARGRRLFVLNAGGREGGADNVAGFRISDRGLLTPVSAATRPLSAGDTDPAQVGFNKFGDVLIVTEKATNLITTYHLAPDGMPSDPQSQPSFGVTPFGFAINDSGHLVVSEAFMGLEDLSATSTYAVDNATGLIEVVSGSVDTTETAACWVACTADGRYAYVTNTGSDSVTGYGINQNRGYIARLDADGVTGFTGEGSAPTDVINLGSHALFVLNSALGTVDAFLIGSDGSLDFHTEATGIPGAPTGLLAD